MARLEQLAAEERARIQKKFHLSQDRIIQEYMRIGFFDIRTLYNEDGTLKAPHDLDDDTAAAVVGMETETVKTVDGEQNTTTSVTTGKVKIQDKFKPLDGMAKMLGMFLEHNVQKRSEPARANVNVHYEIPEHLLQGYPNAKELDDE